MKKDYETAVSQRHETREKRKKDEKEDKDHEREQGKKKNR